MAQTIGDALTARQEDAARTALEALTDVVDVQPTFLRNNISTIVGGMLSIADNATLEPGRLLVFLPMLRDVL